MRTLRNLFAVALLSLGIAQAQVAISPGYTPWTAQFLLSTNAAAALTLLGVSTNSGSGDMTKAVYDADDDGVVDDVVGHSHQSEVTGGTLTSDAIPTTLRNSTGTNWTFGTANVTTANIGSGHVTNDLAVDGNLSAGSFGTAGTNGSSTYWTPSLAYSVTLRAPPTMTGDVQEYGLAAPASGVAYLAASGSNVTKTAVGGGVGVTVDGTSIRHNIQAGANVTLGTNGSALTIAASGGSSGAYVDLPYDANYDASWQTHQILSSGGSFNSIGETASATSGSASAATATFPRGTAIASTAGPAQNANVNGTAFIWSGRDWEAWWLVRVDGGPGGAFASNRVWVGVSPTAWSTVSQADDGTVAGFRLSSTAVDGNWHAYACDGGVTNLVDTLVAGTTNVLFSLHMRNVGTNIVYSINGSPVATNGWNPTAAACAPGCVARTLDTNTVGLTFYRLHYKNKAP